MNKLDAERIEKVTERKITKQFESNMESITKDQDCVCVCHPASSASISLARKSSSISSPSDVSSS